MLDPNAFFILTSLVIYTNQIQFYLVNAWHGLYRASPHPSTVLPLNLKQLFIPLPPPVSLSSCQQGIPPKWYTFLVYAKCLPFIRILLMWLRTGIFEVDVVTGFEKRRVKKELLAMSTHHMLPHWLLGTMQVSSYINSLYKLFSAVRILINVKYGKKYGSILQIFETVTLPGKWKRSLYCISNCIFITIFLRKLYYSYSLKLWLKYQSLLCT